MFGVIEGTFDFIPVSIRTVFLSLTDRKPLFRNVPLPANPVIESGDHSLQEHDVIPQDNSSMPTFGFESTLQNQNTTFDPQFQSASLDPSMLESQFDLLGEAFEFPMSWPGYTFPDNAGNV